MDEALRKLIDDTNRRTLILILSRKGACQLNEFDLLVIRTFIDHGIPINRTIKPTVAERNLAVMILLGSVNISDLVPVPCSFKR